jgi:hypothetical protein
MIEFGVLVGVIVGISEVIKKLEYIPSKFIPIVNIVLGLAGGMLYLHPGDIMNGIIQGLVLGLTAGGFYSSVKNVSEGIR